MKRLIRFAARLYPASWRERYGAEFHALLEDVEPDWRASLNVLKGALVMQVAGWNAGRILVLAGVLGALAAFGVSFAMPKQYVSQPVIKFVPQEATDRVAANDYINRLAQGVASRTALTSVINRFGLYRSLRAQKPIEDIIEYERRNIAIMPLRDGNGNAGAFAIQFTYDDPLTAQRVTQDLTARFIDENMRRAGGDVRMTLQLLDPASLPRNQAFLKRPQIAAMGLAAGVALGGILVYFRRPRKPAKT